MVCEGLLSIQIKVKVQRMSKYSVSVGIVFYNPSQETLQHNIDEAIHMMEKSQNDISFYFLDNGSSQSENFGKVVYPDGVQFIQIAENVGFGGGHNQLLPTIESDVHIVMNPDIHLKDVGNLDEAIDYLMTHETSLLSPQLQSADGQIQLLNRKEPTVLDLAIRLLGSSVMPRRQAEFVKKNTGYNGSIQPIQNATGAFMILKTSDFKQVGGFDDRYFMYMEDTDLTKSLNKNANGALYYPGLVLEHGWKRDNHSFRGMMMMMDSMVKYFNKWGWRLV